LQWMVFRSLVCYDHGRRQKGSRSMAGIDGRGGDNLLLSSCNLRRNELSGSGYAGTFQDIMHIVVTVFVVLLSIASMILITVGCLRSKAHKQFGIFTVSVLAIMALGSIATDVVPVGYFGVAERLSVYSVVIYSAALSLFTFSHSIQAFAICALKPLALAIGI
jgi:hypothetical protein